MPLWQIYHPEPAFSTADKRAIAQKVTALYQDFLPRFYVNVFFHALPPGSAYLGGEPADDFVRVTIDHIARAMDNDAEQQQFLAACTRILHPYIAARGLRWELHVDETPFSLWTIDGLKPPAPGTAAGRGGARRTGPRRGRGWGESGDIRTKKSTPKRGFFCFRQRRKALRREA
ncbi:tautomerase family protein [Serratia marcescens]|uniref:tautomerase family protein n=2 Tax=Serratia TaxID=613 RepID=UPI00339BF083